jgi:hypothetical protein
VKHFEGVGETLPPSHSADRGGRGFLGH